LRSPEFPLETYANTTETFRILLIDDDVELCALVRDYFALKGWTLEVQNDAIHGLASALDGAFDVIILDVMLPLVDGFEVLRQLRRRINTPVIMLTARTAPADRIAGLNAGADDYLPKPFEPDELVARIRAVLRRVRADRPPEPAKTGDLLIDPAARSVTLLGKHVEVTSIEFDILEYLARSSGRIVSREELGAVIYRRSLSPFERVLDVHVSHVRKKLAGSSASIRTVRGVGYLFSSGPEAP
jgi:two-component system, OmpR family, response regulator CpxR